YMHDADIVVCHGGTGSIITGLREGCRTIVIPPLVEKGEHYDKHQTEITKPFADRGLLFPANSIEQLADALRAARSAEPLSATTNPAKLIEHLSDLLSDEQLKLNGID